jgi:two-component system sensor histidine kinase VicK
LGHTFTGNYITPMSADLRHTLPENIFQIIFDKSPGSLLVKADLPRFTIVAASDTYLAVTNTIREAILGKSFSQVFPDADGPDEKTKAQNIFTKVVKTGKKIDIPSYRFDIYNPLTKTYDEHYWSCSNVPIMGDDNKIAYILNTVVDITAEVKTKESAIESENRLRLANEAAGMATWELGLYDQKFICSPRLAEIFGHAADVPITLDDIRAQVNADDMENVVRKAFAQALKQGTYLYEVRIYWPDGTLRWIKTQGIVIYNDDKKPMRMIGTVLDITENKRDEIRKNDFIAMASHELKTPLTSIKAYIQLLAKKIGQTDDPFINNALIKASGQVNKMSDLIYGFLDLSRLESGKLQINHEPFDINELVKEIIAETLLVNPTNTIVFKPAREIIVNADREKIEQVISNFLSNAIKYSPKESTIKVNCKITGDNVQIAVADKGIGIKQKDQEKIFQRFYRAENEKLKNISGFGIGLYLSTEIIQRHKGKIWVESEEDKGSTFYFSIPLF